MTDAVRTWPHRLLARPWIAAFIPVNAATSGFGVALPLLILIDLHGGWADVALAAGLYNAAVIGASVVWGVVADRYKSRRGLLLINFAAFAGLFGALAFSPSIPVLLALYTAVGLVAPAGASAANLLILELFGEAERPTAFASFQEMSILGSIGGLLVGYFWLLAGEPLPPFSSCWPACPQRRSSPLPSECGTRSARFPTTRSPCTPRASPPGCVISRSGGG